jgi:hypothetical protein
MLQSRFALFPIRHNLLQQFVKRFPVMAMHRMAHFVGQYILDVCGRRFYQFRIYPFEITLDVPLPVRGAWVTCRELGKELRKF